jgi:hypothetical protein
MPQKIHLSATLRERSCGRPLRLSMDKHWASRGVSLELWRNRSRHGAQRVSPLHAATHSLTYMRFSTQTGDNYNGQRHGVT